MAFTIEELPQRKGALNADRTAAYTRVFLVDTAADAASGPFGPLAARAAVQAKYGLNIGVPYAYGTAGDPFFEADDATRVTSIQCECIADDGHQWHVTVEYGFLDFRGTENPLDAPPEIEVDQAQFSRIADRDKDGGAVLNSAMDRFDPPIEADDSRTVLRITVNLKEFNQEWAERYRDTINAVAFLGRDPYTLKLSTVRARRLSDPNVPDDHFYWVVNMELHHNRDTWLFHPLDQGYKRLQGTPAKQLSIVTADGQTPSSPVLLDGQGGQLDLSDPANEPFYMEFHVYPEEDFPEIFGFGGEGA